MKIEILGADSLGARSMSTWVETGEHRILIDPGVSVVPYREGLQPHPVELAASLRIRTRILEKARGAGFIFLDFHLP